MVGAAARADRVAGAALVACAVAARLGVPATARGHADRSAAGHRTTAPASRGETDPAATGGETPVRTHSIGRFRQSRRQRDRSFGERGPGLKEYPGAAGSAAGRD